MNPRVTGTLTSRVEGEKNIRIKSLIDNKLNESINAKTLNFTATALDNANRTYKLKGFGSTPGTITKDMFDPKPSSS